jgi:hypothetical protein
MVLPVSVLAQIASILEELGIRYALIGSFASSLHGTYRTTADIDILADIKANQIHPLLERLVESFYADETAIRNAITRQTSFNAIHLDSVFKVDLFIPQDDGFDESQLQRRQLRKVADNSLYVTSAEDTVIAKLNWYRSGNEISKAQWTDVVSILAIQSNLEAEYLRFWAAKLGIADLLQKALDEAR